MGELLFIQWGYLTSNSYAITNLYIIETKHQKTACLWVVFSYRGGIYD